MLSCVCLDHDASVPNGIHMSNGLYPLNAFLIFTSTRHANQYYKWVCCVHDLVNKAGCNNLAKN